MRAVLSDILRRCMVRAWQCWSAATAQMKERESRVGAVLRCVVRRRMAHALAQWARHVQDSARDAEVTRWRRKRSLVSSWLSWRNHHCQLVLMERALHERIADTLRVALACWDHAIEERQVNHTS